MASREQASLSPTLRVAPVVPPVQRNKNLVSAAVSAEELRRGARSQYERPIPMTASQRRLARNKQNAGGLGAGMQASLGERARGGSDSRRFEHR